MVKKIVQYLISNEFIDLSESIWIKKNFKHVFDNIIFEKKISLEPKDCQFNHPENSRVCIVSKISKTMKENLLLMNC